MKKTMYLISAISIFTITTNIAKANVRCSTDTFGTTKCIGYNEKGEWVNTQSRTNSLGTTITTGHIGGQKVNSRTRTKSQQGNGTQTRRVQPLKQY